MLYTCYLYVCIYIYIERERDVYTHTHTCMHTYIHTYLTKAFFEFRGGARLANTTVCRDVAVGSQGASCKNDDNSNDNDNGNTNDDKQK